MGVPSKQNVFVCKQKPLFKEVRGWVCRSFRVAEHGSARLWHKHTLPAMIEVANQATNRSTNFSSPKTSCFNSKMKLKPGSKVFREKNWVFPDSFPQKSQPRWMLQFLHLRPKAKPLISNEAPLSQGKNNRLWGKKNNNFGSRCYPEKIQDDSPDDSGWWVGFGRILSETNLSLVAKNTPSCEIFVFDAFPATQKEMACFLFFGKTQQNTLFPSSSISTKPQQNTRPTSALQTAAQSLPAGEGCHRGERRWGVFSALGWHDSYVIHRRFERQNWDFESSHCFWAIGWGCVL